MSCDRAAAPPSVAGSHAASDQSSLRFMLRDVTADDHQAAEAIVDDLDPFGDPQRYTLWLEVMAALHHRFSMCHDAASARFALTPAHAGIAAALKADLAAHCVAAGDLSLPDICAERSPDCQAGMAYVLEGSSLGARLLQRRARTAGFAHTAYLDLLGDQVSLRRWSRFTAALDESAVAPEQAIAGARAVFRFLIELLQNRCATIDGAGRAAP